MFSLWCKKVRLKILNFHSFILNKEKVASNFSLILEDSTNIYFTMHIFDICPFFTRITEN